MFRGISLNNASSLAVSLVLFILGILLWVQSRKDKTIPNRDVAGILLVVIGAFGIIYEVAAIVMFILYP